MSVSLMLPVTGSGTNSCSKTFVLTYSLIFTCLLLLDMQHLVAWVLTASRVEFQETNSDFHCIVIISCPYIIGIKHSYMQ